MIREAARAADRTVGVLLDLGGPKIRIEGFRDGKVMLEEGKPFALDTALDPKAGTLDCGGRRLQGSAEGCRHGRHAAAERRPDRARTCTASRARASTRSCAWAASFRIARASIARAAASPRRRSPTRIARTSSFAAEEGVDYIAVSFARDAADIEQARTLVRDAGGKAHIVAKIERQEAVTNLIGIIEAADVVMVARGDLGVEMGYAELTGLQKTIIHESRTRNRVVITATQMMESMIQNPMPTRAEVSDVANAVMDGTDAVMLSAETAMGRYPVQAVQAMAEVIEGAEKYQIAHVRSRHGPKASSRARKKRSRWPSCTRPIT